MGRRLKEKELGFLREAGASPDDRTSFQWKKDKTVGKVTVNIPKSQLLTDTKEANATREAERNKFGIGKDFRTVLQRARQFDPNTQIQDPAYYDEISKEIGIEKKSDWEEI